MNTHRYFLLFIIFQMTHFLLCADPMTDSLMALHTLQAELLKLEKSIKGLSLPAQKIGEVKQPPKEELEKRLPKVEIMDTSEPERGIYRYKVLQNYSDQIMASLKNELEILYARDKNKIDKEYNEKSKWIAPEDQFNSAYHALKNAMFMINSLSSKDEKTKENELNKCAQALPYVHLYKQWDDLKEKYEHYLKESKGWKGFSEPEITKLLSLKDVEEKPLIKQADNISVLDLYSIKGVNARFLRGLGMFILPDVIKKFRKNNNFQFVVVARIEPYDTLWIAIAINKINGNTQYLVMNSNDVNPDKNTVNEVIKIFNEVDIEELSNISTIGTIAPKFGPKIEEFGWKGKPSYSDLIKELEDMLNDIKKYASAKIRKLPAFKEIITFYIEPEMKKIRNISSIHSLNISNLEKLFNEIKP